MLFFFPLIQLLLCGIVGWQISPDEHASWIWVVALFWVGMPHGAMDFHVITWVKHKVLGLRYDHQMITYTVLMALTYLGFTVAPVTFVLAFLVLTGLHFGEADRIHAMICHQDGTELPVTWGWLRGALVVGLPTLLAPEQSWAPFEMLSGQVCTPDLAMVLQVFGGAARHQWPWHGRRHRIRELDVVGDEGQLGRLGCRGRCRSCCCRAATSRRTRCSASRR